MPSTRTPIVLRQRGALAVIRRRPERHKVTLAALLHVSQATKVRHTVSVFVRWRSPATDGL